MSAPSIQLLRNGSASPPPPLQRLTAGPLTLDYQSGDLRRIRLGDREVVRRIYAAVRDQDWGTVPGTLSDEVVEAGPDSFRARYTSRHTEGAVDFSWRATIEGGADGTLRFEFEGEALSTFLRNRIGFCVLHPILECAGAHARGWLADGTQRSLTFPSLVAQEQPVAGFHDLAGLDHEISPGVWAELRFSGDVFETEDQRNWIDASFKTFCTSLSLPRPVEVKAGTRIRQAVELRIRGDAGRTPIAATPAATLCTVEFDPALAPLRALPDLGLGAASHGTPLKDSELEQLTHLCLAHLRFDVRFSDASWPARLKVAAGDALELGLPLELVLHLKPAGAGGGAADLGALLETMGRLKADVVRVLVLQEGRRSTPVEALELARRHLGDWCAPIGTGTDADLYQLNLERPPAGDFISWSMNPQVHAFDDASLVETPAAAAQQVNSVAKYYPGIPLVVSPVTLKPRFSPLAAGPATSSEGAIPPDVDTRQASLLGAGWTLAMLAALSTTVVESVTWYETTGWRGLCETAEGTPCPDLFPSMPGALFPAGHFLADLAAFARGQVLPIRVSDPLRLAALAVRSGGDVGVWLANLSSQAVRAQVSGLSGAWRIQFLDELSAYQGERGIGWRIDPRRKVDSDIVIELLPFALTRLGSRSAG